MTEQTPPDQTLDCTHLSCPMPIVEIARTVRDMESGQLLAVQAKDRAFRSDVEAWARRTGHALEEFTEGDVQVALIRIG